MWQQDTESCRVTDMKTDKRKEAEQGARGLQTLPGEMAKSNRTQATEMKQS